MTNADITNEIKSRWEEIAERILEPAQERVNGEPSYICPCGHGTNGDGLTFNPNSKNFSLKCFGCGFSGSIIDLYMQMNNIDFNRAVEELAEMLHIPIDKPATKRQSAAEDFKTEDAPKPVQEETQPAADFSAYYDKCYNALRESKEAQKYLKARGLTGETVKRFKIGYDPQKRRIIISHSKSFYTARDITNAQEPKYLNPPGGTAQLFNAAELQSENNYIFVTEGALDALSIIEASGGEASAIAIGGTPHANLLTEAAKSKDFGKIIIIALDNDKQGKETADKLARQLEADNKLYIIAHPYGKYKDANETLINDKAELKKAITAAIEQAQQILEHHREHYSVLNYIKNGYEADRQKFQYPIETGFTELDGILNGGLRAGLYTVAAGSSLGKTTFCHQIADYLAEHGTNVLYFSLEQSAFELVSKSLARLKAIDLNVGMDFLGHLGEADYISHITSNYGIKAGKVKCVATLLKRYEAKVEDRLSIIEGDFGITTADIKNIVEQHITYTKRKPVLFIDYLQLIKSEAQQPEAIRIVMDNAVQELKQLSRSAEIPIIIIAAINRANYLTPISFESIKESGGIEYTSDVVIGLQLACLYDNEVFKSDKKITEKREEIQKAKRSTPRYIDLSILKNRNGRTGDSIRFDYYPLCDLFREVNEFEDVTPEQKANAPWGANEQEAINGGKASGNSKRLLAEGNKKYIDIF